MENRNGLVAQSCLTHATGTAERDAALVLVDRLGPRRRRITLGADKGYDVLGFVHALRQRRVTPHIASDRRVSKTDVVRRLGVDGRTTRHPGYAVSQRIRKRIEEVFGWRRDKPPDTAATTRERRSRDSGLPMHAGLLPSTRGESHLARLGKSL